MRRLKVLFSVVALVILLALSLSGCAPSEYKLSSSSNPDAGGAISPATGTYQKEVGVDVTAAPASGYRFDHWEGGASGESPTVHVVMDRNKNLVAYFTKTYVLSASSTPASAGSVSPTSGTYDEADNVTIIATPAQYYNFNGWAGDASGSSDHLTITMDSNKTVVASFTKLTYSVQTQVDASGGGTIDPGSGAFEAGTYVNITATPASGYRFDHWGGSATGSSNPVNILIDTNKTVTAYFIQPTRLEDVNFYIVGTWQGVVDTPWVPDYHCQITFNDNLTYSVKSVDSTPVLYYGDDADSACKTYRVTDMNDDGTATGEIAITWDYTNDCGDTSLDQLRRISFSNGYNTLHFEFWHFDHYGPVVFDLTRVP